MCMTHILPIISFYFRHHKSSEYKQLPTEKILKCLCNQDHRELQRVGWDKDVHDLVCPVGVLYCSLHFLLLKNRTKVMFKGLYERMVLLGKVSGLSAVPLSGVTCVKHASSSQRHHASLEIFRSNSQEKEVLNVITGSQPKNFNKEKQNLEQKVFRIQHYTLNL